MKPGDQYKDPEMVLAGLYTILAINGDVVTYIDEDGDCYASKKDDFLEDFKKTKPRYRGLWQEKGQPTNKIEVLKVHDGIAYFWDPDANEIYEVALSNLQADFERVKK